MGSGIEQVTDISVYICSASNGPAETKNMSVSCRVFLQ